MQIVEDKALLLTLQNPKQITTVIPKSKELSLNKVVVNWGVDEAHTLQSLNIRVPSPIEKQYRWVGKFTPYQHQKDTASFLTMNKKAFCFNEQGTGKTASAIWAADFLMQKVVKDVIANGGFDLIIVDEATHYKNVQTKRWKTLKKLVNEDTWVWMMTGTPAAQSPLDAYGLAKMVNPLQVPRFFGTFREQVMYRVTQFKWVAKDTAKSTVFAALQPAIRFTKEQCLDLPDMVYTKRKIKLTTQQKKYYEMLRKRMVMQVAGEHITAVNAAVNINKLLQISAGAIYTDDGDSIQFDISNRYKVLREVIDECSQKVLVFVPFRHTIDMLADKLTSDGITSDIIRGDVSAHKRSEIFERFQNTPDPKVLSTWRNSYSRKYCCGVGSNFEFRNVRTS